MDGFGEAARLTKTLAEGRGGEGTGGGGTKKNCAGYGWTQLTVVALHPSLVTFIGLGYPRRLHFSIKYRDIRKRTPMTSMDAPHRKFWHCSLDFYTLFNLAMQGGFHNNCKCVYTYIYI